MTATLMLGFGDGALLLDLPVASHPFFSLVIL